MIRLCLLTPIALLSLSAIRPDQNSSGPSIFFSTLTDVTQSSGTINLATVDGNGSGISNTLTISGIPSGSTINEIVVTIKIDHTWLADIVVNLESPDNKIVNLIGNRGGASTYGYDNVEISSNNSLAALPTGDYGSARTGTYKADAKDQTTLNTDPNNSGIVTTPSVTTTTFSDLFSTVNGNWKIRVYDVYDDEPINSIGQLVSWSIKISFTPPVVTPVTLLTFSGYREGNHNLLKWSTASEQTNKGFQVERSVNGITYSSLDFVNSKALNGNSSSLLQYSFNDNNLSGTKQYYRLRQIDIDNREKLSNIIVIKGQRPTSLYLSGLFPNPAKNIMNIIIDAPADDIVDLIISDMNGKLIKKQSSPVEAGANTIAIDISGFASGPYTIKLTCKSNCEAVTGRFIKQ